MTFGNKRDRHPDLHCSCGHPARQHLYCGDHSCVVPGCSCEGYSPEVREVWLAASRFPGRGRRLKTAFAEALGLVSARA